MTQDLLSLLYLERDKLAHASGSKHKGPGPQTSEAVETFARYMKANCHGPAKARANREIAEAFNLRDVGSGGRPGQGGSATISRLVLEARKAGHPICADRHKLYYAVEVKDTLASRRQDLNNAIRAVERLSAMETACLRVFGE